MNILLIGYCHLDDGFLYASKALEKLGYTIYFFPYLTYIMDKIACRDELIIRKIKSDNINICLWWCNNITHESYDKIINKSDIEKNIKHYFFNWDFLLYNYEKYNSIVWKERVENKKLCYQIMDHVFTCYQKEIDIFKNNISISYAYPGFDKKISYYLPDDEYECDISIVCTNLYKNENEFPNDATNISRYEIVDKLYENRHKINFHIYGYENLKEEYPECYRGFIKYQQCNKVFSNSKINLSIHPIVNELFNENSEYEYFSERVPQILGCKGLLMTNSILKKNLVPDEDYIYIDRNMDWFEKINEIITNNEKYDNMRENGHKKGIQFYQWIEFAKEINKVTLTENKKK
jgi:hypothetical protein